MRRVASAEISPAATPLYDAPLSLPRSSVGHVFMTGMSNGQALCLRSRCRNEADPTGLGALLEMPRKSPHYQPCNRGSKRTRRCSPTHDRSVLCSRGSCVHRARVLKHPAPTRRQAGSHRGLPDAPVEPCVKTLGQRQRYHPRAPSLEGCVEVFGIISCFCASCVMMSSKVCFGSVCFSVTFRKGKLWL